MRYALPAVAILLAGCGSTPGTIAFTSTRDGNAEVYSVRADGSHLVDLTRNLAQDGEPAWSPDGKTIAFVSTRDGNAQLFLMNPDGSGQRRLTHDGTSDMAPAWSPDGKRIAYMCTLASPRVVTEICVVGANGRGRQRLSSGDDNLYPHWTPRGRVIWTKPNARIAEAAYSSTGTLAELREEEDAFSLYAGGRRLATGVDSFAWSPDGKSIAYVHDRNIYVGGKQLTHGAAASLNPRWSSDGRWIAFERLRRQHSDVYVVRADGGGLRDLTHEIGKNGGPDWRP